MSKKTTIAAAAVLTGGLIVGGAGGAVAGHLVTSADIKNGTVRSVDVRNGSVRGVDVRQGSVRFGDLGARLADNIATAPDFRQYEDLLRRLDQLETVTCANYRAGALVVPGGRHQAPDLRRLCDNPE